VWFQKISTPLPQKVIGNSEKEGVLKAKVLKRNYAEGSKQKPSMGGSMDIFWNNTMTYKHAQKI